MLKDIIENKKSLGEPLETVSVRCKYCGQTLLTEVTAEMVKNEEILNDLAIEICECSAAKTVAKRKKRTEQLEEKLTECIGIGSDSPVEDKVFNAIRTTAQLVCFGDIDKATFKLNEIEKVSLRTDANGILHIDREKKKKTTRTI